MIDQRDDKTGQLIPLPPRRGRPSKGAEAMSGAERMRRYREKRAEAAKLIETRATSYAQHNPMVMIDDLAEAIQTGDPDDVTRARAAWIAYGKLMGWI